jgi:vesicle coat complex subunit
LEEMYYTLKNKEPFDEHRYARNLSRLHVAENDYRQFSIKELIETIEHLDGTFPKHILQEIINSQDEAIPILIDILKKVLEGPDRYAQDESYFGHIYASYLLAQFRVKEAYPIFIAMLRLPDELPHQLFGDTICEAGSRILASICGGEVEPIKELITNTEADEFVRSAAVMSLAILVLHGVLPRKDVMEYYRMLLTIGVEDRNPIVIAEVVSSCNNLYPEEAMKEIQAVFENKWIEDNYIDYGFIEETLTAGKDNVLERYKHDSHHQFIDDTIEELHWWACFQEESFAKEEYVEDIYDDNQPIKEFKTGRNDPCPCGSGKKYKKCCGK